MPVPARIGLVAGPLVLLVARFLLVPYWDEADVYIRDVAGDPVRSDFGASLVIVGAMLLVNTVRVLAGIVGPMPHAWRVPARPWRSSGAWGWPASRWLHSSPARWCDSETPTPRSPCGTGSGTPTSSGRS